MLLKAAVFLRRWLPEKCQARGCKGHGIRGSENSIEGHYIVTIALFVESVISIFS